MKSTFFVLSFLIAGTAQAAGLLLSCQRPIQPATSRARYGWHSPDAGLGTEVDLQGSFLNAVPEPLNYSAESLQTWATRQGLVGTLRRIQFRAPSETCRWKASDTTQAPHVITCATYEVSVTITNEMGQSKVVKVKSLHSGIERVTRDTPYGSRVRYESGLQVQDMDDRMYRSLQSFETKQCAFEA
jgi:hypothetical protein